MEIEVPIKPYPIKLSEEHIARFHERYAKTDGCWPWLGRRNRAGYGRLSVSRRSLAAHRVSYAIHNGRDPGELFVCHACDNPSCVNPNHLWLGTVLDNNRDSYAKGRSRNGGYGPKPEFCVKCGHHRIDDVPPFGRTPARCRQCKKMSRPAARARLAQQSEGAR